MTAERKCAECGAAIPPGATDGVCAQCLFSLGLEAPDTPSPARPPPDLAPLLARSMAAIGVKFHYFGDYELLEEIARGGMGIVFKARQVSLNRLVALKLISAGALATEELIKRFKAEAEAAASLAHPNIVPIYEVGEHHGQHYFSMGLVEGPNLREALRQTGRADTRAAAASTSGGLGVARAEHSRSVEGPAGGKPATQQIERLRYSTREAANLLSTIARSVHYAHQRGVLHRDIKPSNILLDGNNEPHLTDFGLAKLMEKESALTQTNAVMGTPAYMSPEQARGKTKAVTTAADVYGLGAVLYETLTGSPPFAGGTPMETIRQVLDQEPQRPSLCNPAVDRDLETICLKCLEKEPHQRYGSAEALADDLQRWLRHDPILARPSSVFERVIKWARRQPVLAAAVVLLHLVLAMGLAGILWQWNHAVVARRAEAAERQRAVRAEAEALAHLHQAKLNYVRANRLSGRLGQRFDSLAELAQTATRTNRLESRNEAIACFLLPDARLRRQWPKTEQWYSFRFDSSHRRYATNDALGNLTIRDTETDGVLAQVPVRGPRDIFFVAAFSPDDRFLATVDNAGQGRLWEGLTQAPRLVDLPSGAELWAFTPDSRALLVKRGDDSAHFLNIAKGEEKFFSAPPGLSRSGYQLNASGEKSLTNIKGKVVVWRAVDGEHLQTLTPPEGATDGLWHVKWHPDGRRVAAAWLNHIGLWDSETGRRLAVFEGHESGVVGLAFTPGGEYLVSVAWDTTTRFWELNTGREVLRLPDAGNALSISADGRRLSFQSWDHRLVKLYELPDLTAGQRIPLPPPTRHREHYTAQAVFSPDGALVAVPDREGIYIFDASTRAPQALLPVSEMGSVCFSPDGHALITGGTGVQRWPLKWSADRAELHLGPPQVIEPTRGLPVTWVDLSRDGRTLVVQANHTTPGNHIVMTLRTTPPYEAVRLGKILQLGVSPRISPDGRWVATVPSSFDQIHIWNGHTGKVITNLSTQKGWQPVFSPDGRWLAGMERDSMTVWETSDWKVRRRIAHPSVADVKNGLEFSPDGRIIATFSSDWRVQLLSFDTGEELGEFPAGRVTHSVCFASTGDRFAVADQTGYFQLWNVRRVREQLAALKLDWGMPPYPPEQAVFAQSPFRVIVHANAPAVAPSEGEAEMAANRKELVPTSAQLAELRKSIPAREANLSPALIDLSGHYNGSLLKIWGHGAGNDLSALKPGVHRFGGVDYDVRGLIQVRPSHNHGLPRAVTGIPINRKCTRLHFLHLTGYFVKKGTQVGAYIIHFKSGQRLEKPIIFGRDVDNWWFRADEPPTLAHTVWTGRNADADRYGSEIRLFHTDWKSPWPDEEIASIDMVSSLTACNPCLIAITAE